MLLIAVGIGFLLLFAVLISDGISSGSTGTTDVSSRPRRPDTETAASESEAPPAITRHPDDGIDLAA
ncbi:hypothetical protein [Mycobacterium sp. 1245111.1]|uniref:hypothetical protein n=1 Tax=Mycobacterium sp. 1245111.1 TaxID=1834073 RepID=UPI0012EA3131|nr:hypothetical protein [Mycobacterium sp. 1245111.1]